MPRQLAEELQKAGFPLVKVNRYEEGEFIDTLESGNDTFPFRYPNLEELIEECGDGFNALLKMQNLGKIIWMAQEPMKEYFKSGQGSTPTEAVARLWLALNNKSV